MVDEAEVAEVVEHGELGLGEVGFAVVLAELEAAEHEEEGEDVHGVHSHLGKRLVNRLVRLRIIEVRTSSAASR